MLCFDIYMIVGQMALPSTNESLNSLSSLTRVPQPPDALRHLALHRRCKHRIPAEQIVPRLEIPKTHRNGNQSVQGQHKKMLVVLV